MYKITIDPGHNHLSNVSPINKNYIEGERMWKLGCYLKDALEEYGIEAVLTRPTVTTDLPIPDRGKLAAKNGSDLFVSLHSNAPAPRKNGTYDTTVTGTYVYYSLTDGDNKDLADKLGGAIAAKMGHKFRGSLTREFSEERPNWDYYGVIRNAAQNGCKAAFLIEHGYHTCPKDIAFLMSDANLMELAQAEAKVVAEYFGVTRKLYRLQLGAFRNKEYAQNFLTEINEAVKKLGVKAFIVED